MKKFSQYINSQEDCGCNQVQEALSFGAPLSLTKFAKGAAIGVAKTIGGTAVEKLGGKLGQAALAGGQEGDTEANRVVGSKLECKERSLGLKRQLASQTRTYNNADQRCKTTGNKEDCDDAARYEEIKKDTQAEIDHHEAECDKVQSAKNDRDVLKAKISGQKKRLQDLGGTP